MTTCRRKGLGRTQAKELRLGLRALRALRRHVQFASSLHRSGETLGFKLEIELRNIGALERRLVDLINQSQKDNAPQLAKRRAA